MSTNSLLFLLDSVPELLDRFVVPGIGARQVFGDTLVQLVFISDVVGYRLRAVDDPFSRGIDLIDWIQKNIRIEIFAIAPEKKRVFGGPSRRLIGCYTSSFSGIADGTCQATNSAGTSAFCFPSDPNMVAVMQSASTDSYIFFQYDASSNCLQVDVDNFSYFEPKVR